MEEYMNVAIENEEHLSKVCLSFQYLQLFLN